MIFYYFLISSTWHVHKIYQEKTIWVLIFPKNSKEECKLLILRYNLKHNNDMLRHISASLINSKRSQFPWVSFTINSKYFLVTQIATSYKIFFRYLKLTCFSKKPINRSKSSWPYEQRTWLGFVFTHDLLSVWTMMSSKFRFLRSTETWRQWP